MKKGFDYNFHTYDSGLRLITVPMPATKTVTVLVLVATGSKYETKEINGISHFLEHMMFKGTAKRPGYLDISRELDAIGADYNAFTSKEYTGYFAKASSDKLQTVLDVIFDVFLNSKLDEKAIETEKGVIIEELNMRQDIPQEHVGKIYEKLLYGDQPAGWEIAGEKETVLKLERPQFVDYFNTHYIASNTVVAVAGDIDPADVRERTGEYFKNIRRGKTVTKPAVAQDQDKPELTYLEKKTDQSHFLLGCRAYHMFDERRYALGVLGTILGGGMSSRLFDEIREKRGLAYYVRAGQQNYTDTGYFAVSAGVNNGKVIEAVQVILRELQKVKAEGVTEPELRQAKDHITGKTALGLEHSDAVAEAYAEPVLFENKVLTPEEELDRIQKVTLADIKQVAGEVFDSRGLNLALVGPKQDYDSLRNTLKL